jgi:hypothetical protein
MQTNFLDDVRGVSTLGLRQLQNILVSRFCFAMIPMACEAPSQVLHKICFDSCFDPPGRCIPLQERVATAVPTMVALWDPPIKSIQACIEAESRTWTY